MLLAGPMCDHLVQGVTSWSEVWPGDARCDKLWEFWMETDRIPSGGGVGNFAAGPLDGVSILFTLVALYRLTQRVHVLTGFRDELKFFNYIPCWQK